MPNSKPKNKLLCIETLSHSEYYGLQETFEKLYQQSTQGKTFSSLMPLIFSKENILLAYRNIKANKGSKTPGTDGVTINEIGKLSPDEVTAKILYIVKGSKHGYRPKPVRRKDIPKQSDPTKTRPLGIPCMWDRLIQQCIKQVLEPICEAKFSNRSYGFRPNRSARDAIGRMNFLLQNANLHYVIEFDIKGFFDNVNHKKLLKQIWTLGIHDKELLYVIQKILKAPVKMPDGKLILPDKGTPQGGIISPLLANIVLNELDHWVESQWENNPIAIKHTYCYNGQANKGAGYRVMRKTNMKEMFIVRYADDFRIFCRNKSDAQNILTAVTLWLKERLKLEVSPEKTKIVNARKHNTEFLGFKTKLCSKGKNKYKVVSHMGDKALKNAKEKLVQQAHRIAKPPKNSTEAYEVMLYNTMVMGIQNYYSPATLISADCRVLHRAVMTTLTNRLTSERGTRLVRKGRKLTDVEQKRYGKSKMLRFLAGSEEPIYPVGFIKNQPALQGKNLSIYTPEGREFFHTNLQINTSLLMELMQNSHLCKSVEYADNRISLFSAQKGKCSVTGKEFTCTDEIHCHHVIPKKYGGDDKYSNLTLVLNSVHILIHATDGETIHRYLSILNLDKNGKKKLNSLREKANNPPI